MARDVVVVGVTVFFVQRVCGMVRVDVVVVVNFLDDVDDGEDNEAERLGLAGPINANTTVEEQHVTTKRTTKKGTTAYVIFAVCSWL
jgi:hypothetical protein